MVQASLTLPPELILDILACAAEVFDDKLLLSLRLVSRTFDHLIRSSHLWDRKAVEQWKRGPCYNPQVMVGMGYSYYRSRSLVDCVVQEHVRNLAVSISGKLGPIDELRNLGEAALDQLEREKCITPEEDPQQWLARKYWASEAWNAILRLNARQTWRRIAAEADGDYESPDSFEEGVMAFAAFRGVDRVTLRERYDRIMPKFVEACTPALEIVDSKAALQFIAMTITERMEAIGIRAARGGEYHLLGNHFLDVVFARTDAEDPTATTGTLPMSLVSVFTSIVRRLPANFNIQARAIGFPGNLLAAVARADDAPGEEEFVYVNVFDRGKILHDSDFPALLRATGVPVDSTSWRRFVLPTHAAELCARVAQNIINSVRQRDAAPSDMSTALFATANASFILSPTQRTTYANWIVSLVQSEFSLDVAALEHVAVEIYQDDPGRLTEVLELCQSIKEEDATVPAVKERPPEILWRCGHVFQHRLFGYVAVVRGWDTTCLASEQWILQMRVDTLPHGRHQPFYHVICEDSSRRYVASENITNVPVEPLRFASLLAVSDLGLYFRTTERDEQGRQRSFLMNEKLKAEYRFD